MQDNNPLVSIVIPVHNGERYIKEAIDSCLQQTYSTWELIVVDDESTDSTLEILKEYGSKIKIVSISKQKALGNVINIGIREAKGKYVCRMDADDVMYPTRIYRQVEYLETYVDCVAVGGQLDIIDQDGKIVDHREYALEDKDIKKNMFLFQPFAHPAVMLRKSSAEEIGLYPEDMPKVEDVKFFFMLSLKGKFANLPDTVLKYRMTFNTESQTRMFEHFKKTNEVRNWAINELGIKPTLGQNIKWKVEIVGVSMLSILPPKMFMKTFEFVRRIFK